MEIQIPAVSSQTELSQAVMCIEKPYFISLQFWPSLSPVKMTFLVADQGSYHQYLLIVQVTWWQN